MPWSYTFFLAEKMVIPQSNCLGTCVAAGVCCCKWANCGRSMVDQQANLPVKTYLGPKFCVLVDHTNAIQMKPSP